MNGGEKGKVGTQTKNRNSENKEKQSKLYKDENKLESKALVVKYQPVQIITAISSNDQLIVKLLEYNDH